MHMLSSHAPRQRVIQRVVDREPGEVADKGGGRGGKRAVVQHACAVQSAVHVVAVHMRYKWRYTCGAVHYNTHGTAHRMLYMCALLSCSRITPGASSLVTLAGRHARKQQCLPRTHRQVRSSSTHAAALSRRHRHLVRCHHTKHDTKKLVKKVHAPTWAALVHLGQQCGHTVLALNLFGETGGGWVGWVGWVGQLVRNATQLLHMLLIP